MKNEGDISNPFLSRHEPSCYSNLRFQNIGSYVYSMTVCLKVVLIGLAMTDVSGFFLVFLCVKDMILSEVEGGKL